MSLQGSGLWLKDSSLRMGSSRELVPFPCSNANALSCKFMIRFTESSARTCSATAARWTLPVVARGDMSSTAA